MEATAKEELPAAAPRDAPRPEAARPDEHKAPAAPKARSGARRPLIILGVLAIAGAGAYGYHAYRTAGEEDTDDAQVEADVIPIAARTGGLVLSVHVHDNQVVHEGDVLVELDRAELEARVAQARAERDTAHAQLDAANADVQLVGATANG